MHRPRYNCFLISPHPEPKKHPLCPHTYPPVTSMKCGAWGGSSWVPINWRLPRAGLARHRCHGGIGHASGALQNTWWAWQVGAPSNLGEVAGEGEVMLLGLSLKGGEGAEKSSGPDLGGIEAQG